MGYSVDPTVPHVLPDFLKGLVLRWSSLSNNSRYDNGGGDDNIVVHDASEATIATSKLTGNSPLHRVILDIDYLVEVIPSSTEGHYHLVLNRHLLWEDYEKLLRALAEATIIEDGYANASIRRGYSSIRLPWIKKA